MGERIKKEVNVVQGCVPTSEAGLSLQAHSSCNCQAQYQYSALKIETFKKTLSYDTIMNRFGTSVKTLDTMITMRY